MQCLIKIRNQHIFFILSLFTLGVDPFPGIPLNLSQWIVLLWFLYQSLFTKKIIGIYLILFNVALFWGSIILYYHNFDFEMLKKLIGIFIYSFTLYNYVYHYRYKLQEVISFYLFACIIISIIAIVQEIGWFIKISWLYDFSYLNITNPLTPMGKLFRATSITSEPAHLAYMLFPGFFLSVLSILGINKLVLIKKYQILIIVTAMIFSFSLVGYFSMIICLIYYIISSSFNKGKKILLVGLLTLLFVTIIKNENIFDRIKLMQTETFAITSNTKSQWALISNAYVAYSSLINNPLGTGIQTHQLNYNKYISGIYSLGEFNVNTEDANSLYLRLISEFGIFGICAIISFYLFFKIKDSTKSPYRVLNTLALFFLFIYSIRMGGYLNPLFWFFVNITIVTKWYCKRLTFPQLQS